MSVKSSRSDGRWDHMRESLQSCPSWRPFYFTLCKQTAPVLWPWSVRLLGRVGGARCVTHILAGDSPAAPAPTWERVWLQLGRAPWNSFQPFWSCSLVLSRSDCCMAGTGWGQPAPGSEWRRDVLTPKCHFWGTVCKTWPACVDTKPSPPPGDGRKGICQVSQCFSLSVLILHSGQQNISFLS